MAGEGSRFVAEGYTTPKPLIEVDGKPMIVRAVEDLPKGDNYVFISRDFHIEKYHIDHELKKYFKDAKVIGLNYLTEGQASTCLLAKDIIDPDDELIIGACDNGMIYDKSLFEEKKKQYDVMAFTFRNNVTVIEKPQQYGWLKTSGEKIIGTSIKKQLSDTPMKDHAVVGAFWFKKGSHFINAAEKMIRENRRINNEFYVDECMQDCIDLGLNTGVFEINHYLCWGTPNDYKTYNYWKDFFTKVI